MKTTAQSLTTESVIRNEANKVITALYNPDYPITPIVAESVFESLMGVAYSLDLPVAKTLNIRLVAIRNNIHVCQLQEVA